MTRVLAVLARRLLIGRFGSALGALAVAGVRLAGLAPVGGLHDTLIVARELLLRVAGLLGSRLGGLVGALGTAVLVLTLGALVVAGTALRGARAGAG